MSEERRRPELELLVVDAGDQVAIRRVVEHLLLEGHRVAVANSVVGARRRLIDDHQDVVLLADAGSPAATLSLLRELRGGEIQDADPRLRVLTIGADRDAVAVLHYRAGANLVLASTATPELVSAAVQTVAGQTSATRASPSSRLRVGSLVLDVHAQTAHSGEQQVALTRRERDLLVCLAQTPGRTFSRLEISREVWGSELMAYNSRTIDSHMHRLRDKLGTVGEAQRLRSTWGVGYRLER